MYFVPHFGHAKVYETSIWTPCFQISAKTLPVSGLWLSGGRCRILWFPPPFTTDWSQTSLKMVEVMAPLIPQDRAEIPKYLAC